MQFTRKRIIYGIGLGVGLLVLGLVINALIPRATILFSVAPQEIVVVINGDEHEITNGDEVTVAPGEVVLELKQDEFDSTGETFVIENGETREILVALNPQTADAESLLQNRESQIIIERIGGRAVLQGAQQLREQYPIITELPINERFYTVRTCESEREDANPDDIAICVQLYTLEARQSALNDIERRGFALEDYEIIVQDRTFENNRERTGI
jgi:hypothetical protein